MPRIVIADDEPDIVAILSGRFRAAGFEVFAARNGTEALQAVKAHRPDVLVSDVMMPELNGFQVCRRVRSEPDLASVRLVLLTAKDSEADRFWGTEVGADLYLAKPVDPARVVAQVRSLLEG